MLSGKGGNYNNGSIEQTAEINLVDKSTNSLKQLNQYAAKLSELYKEKRKKMKEEAVPFQDMPIMMDSAVAIPEKTK